MHLIDILLKLSLEVLVSESTGLEDLFRWLEGSHLSSELEPTDVEADEGHTCHREEGMSSENVLCRLGDV